MTAPKTVPTGLTALADRRGFDRLADADAMVEQSPIDQELLRAFEHLRRGVDKRLALLVERRESQHADTDERADQEEIQNEDREPARKSFVAYREQPLLFNEPDHRAEPDRQQAADVEEQQDLANQVRGEDDDDGEGRHHDRVADQRLLLGEIGWRHLVVPGEEILREVGDQVVDRGQLRG